MNLDTLAVFRRDGAHTMTVQAIDGGYNVSSVSRRVYVDNTAPNQPGGLVVACGGTWRSVNRFAASWVAPANSGAPIAGIVYELCRTDQPRACVSGRRWGSDLTSIRDLVMPADGSWMLRLWLRDAAGNEDRNRSVSAGPLRVDRVPPSVRMLPRNPNDPARLTVEAADASSGVSRMEIEIRRRGEAAWRSLPLERQGARFSAVVNDELLARGVYDVRARATDAAGNERTAAADSTGAPAAIRLPARIASTLHVGRPVGRGRGRRLAARVSTRFGAPTLLAGRLTAPGGNPVQGAEVQVWQRTALVGSQFSRLGTIRTARNGRFRFRVPRGTSRIVRFRYPGTRVQRGATRDVSIGVPAATSIRVRPRLAVNGEYVTFRGRLRGGPIPLAESSSSSRSSRGGAGGRSLSPGRAPGRDVGGTHIDSRRCAGA